MRHIDFNYEEVEEKLSYKFQNKELLQQAFIHSSYAHEQKDMLLSYERLEFLGDAVLEMVSSLFLFIENPLCDEGFLTKTRARMVCTASLSSVAINLGITKFIVLGKGECSKNIDERTSILEDVIEAIIGAIYLDGGFDKAQEFITRNILKQEQLMFRDYKSEVQEILQAKPTTTIAYEIIKEEGPEHNKLFTCVLKVDGHIQTKGIGKSKKAANQEAAKAYLQLHGFY